MGAGEQLVTVGAVLIGALSTHVTNHLMERSRNRYQLLTRWDDKKVEAYGGYVDAARLRIAAAGRVYEPRRGCARNTGPRRNCATS
ncbi:hypothetical protein [Streptomyces sp. NPDC101234]|uniref:hypothetical protein n=1 Tax=Streptomyces sp. NPDC101234 TaxID=3366138 RepID=UPI00381C1100